MIPNQKRIQVKSYDSSGTFIKIIPDVEVTGFKKTINGGLGLFTFRVDRGINDFNTDEDITLGNKIEVKVFDIDNNTEGVFLYSGFIVDENIEYEDKREFVSVSCVGNYSKLSQDVLKTGSQTTLYTTATGLTVTSGSQASGEVSVIAKAIIDSYNNNTENSLINYETDDTPSVTPTTNIMQYTFEAKTFFDAIDKCREYGPQNTYWYIDAENVFHFKQKPITATHKFTFGKDIKSIRVNKNIFSLKNVLLLWGTDKVGADVAYKEYKDDTSIGLYGRRIEQSTELNVEDEASMDNVGNSYINENKDPIVTIEVEVADNNGVSGTDGFSGYDIESIEVGDTCKIENVADNGLFGENMTIIEVNWTKDAVIIEIEAKVKNVSKILASMSKAVDSKDLVGIPTIYS